MTKRESNCICQSNSLLGVGHEKGIGESGEEAEDAQLVYLLTKLVLPALR